MGISTFKLTIVAAILFQAVISNQILIQVPEILHKEFQIEWYEVANQYAIEHYKENSVIKNEEFYNFTAKIDGLMQKKILNVTNVDITDTTADTTKNTTKATSPTSISSTTQAPTSDMPTTSYQTTPTSTAPASTVVSTVTTEPSKNCSLFLP